MAANNTWTGTTNGTSSKYITIHSTSSDSTPEYEFPEWADEGRIVIDRDNNEWLVVGQYIDEDNKGILQLENEELGLEAEAKIEEVEEFW